jgi:hypothetical protein
MISRPEQLLNELVSLCPEFSQAWSEEAYLWVNDEGKPCMPCGVFAAFSHYIADRLRSGNMAGLHEVFEFVEGKMSDEDEEISTAAATCFLENLMNRTPDDVAPQAFIPLLGAESREYCRAWDEFCGTRTEGLW